MAMSFHNDGQIAHTHEAVATVLAAYGIEDFTYTVAPGGIENTTFVVVSDEQRYALRVYRASKNRRLAMQEVAFMEVLRSKGLPVPEIHLTVSGQALAHVSFDGSGWYALLQSFMPGKHPEKYDDRLLAQLAVLQARMHGAGAVFAETEGRHNRTLTRLSETQFIKHMALETLHPSDLREFLQRAKDYSISIDPALPCGYSHFDFDAGNVLVSEDQTVSGILDFDDLMYAPFAICLGYTLYDILETTNNEAFVHQYIALYEQERKLTANERAWLPIAMLFRHYVLSSLGVLNGKTQPAAVQRYRLLEKQLMTIEC